MSDDFPDQFFVRQDPSDDARFYEEPRFVTHIDDATIAALTDYYREVLPTGGVILDLMSSWISHLPPDVAYGEVQGLGMNQAELDRNPQLTAGVVHDLNQNPNLPYPPDHFDAVLIAVSVQYLVQPIAVFREINRVLKPGGRCIVAMSHRLFPTKAIYAFHVLPREDRFRIVGHYLQSSGISEDVAFVDRSPTGADPLWIVTGNRPA